MDNINLPDSGRIERVLGKYFRSDNVSHPVKVILWVMVFAYVPLVLIAAFEGYLYKGEVDIPFLLDYNVQFRSLIAIPLLIFGRKMVREKLQQTNLYIRDTLLDEDQYANILLPAIKKIQRFNKKGYDELVIIVVLIIFSLLMSHYNISKIGIITRSNWFGQMLGDKIHLTTAAKWHLFIR